MCCKVHVLNMMVNVECISNYLLCLRLIVKEDFGGSRNSTSFALEWKLRKKSVSGNATVSICLKSEEHEICHCDEEQASDARNVRASFFAAASARSVPKAHNPPCPGCTGLLVLFHN